MSRKKHSAGVLAVLVTWAICTPHSMAQESTLIVTKDVSPVKDLTIFSFTIEGEEEQIPFELEGEESDQLTLDPGTYVIREDVPEGWELSFIRCGDFFEAGPVASGALQIVLEPEDSTSCRFANTMLDVPPPPPPVLAIPALSPTGLAVSTMLLSILGAFALRRFI